ncbi:L-xylulose reductase-like [Tubulanus polymorphus]|uniref:L-xylulose reductase-like n=1 Tax=Tubulanus polymorphus TaxID=672921 RepID=UPI003DA60068
MEINFSGKRALVTGAGKGIGRQCVKTLLECGAHVVALTRTQTDLDTLKREHPSIETVCVDLLDWNKTREAVLKVLPIDLLVNNAGICEIVPFLSTTEACMDRTLGVNLKGYVNVAQVVAQSMIERKCPGTIVNVSSILGSIVWDNYGAYCMSKGAVDQLTRSMALELGQHGIRTNAVCPTVVATPMCFNYWAQFPKETEYERVHSVEHCPLSKYAEVQDVVNQIVHLLSNRSTMVNGTMIRVDGGHCVW